MLRSGRLVCIFAVILLGPSEACVGESLTTLTPPTEGERLFLDRLMAVESGGRLSAKNPASSALGPFQFLRTTFLDIIRRDFPLVSEGKSDAEILALRTDREIARNAALIYTRENARFLSEHGAVVSAANLRLAFFVGPSAALKVLTAKPEEPVSHILSASALEANPFLGQMTAAALIERSSLETGSTPTQFRAAAARQLKAAVLQNEKPKIAVFCNLKLPSCRKWLDLAEKRTAIRTSLKEARLVRPAARR